jgi:hypothetical protein
MMRGSEFEPSQERIGGAFVVVGSLGVEMKILGVWKLSSK